MKFNKLCHFALCLSLVACATAPKSQKIKAESSDIGKKTEESFSAEAAVISSVTELDLQTAFAICDRYHPKLKEMQNRILAADGQVMQSDLFPNPNLVLRAEQIPTRKKPREFIQPVVGITQEIPVAGRLGKAKELALAKQEQEKIALEVTRRSLHRIVRGKFATALYMDRVSEYQRQTKKLAKDLVAISKARVKAGEVAPDELAVAELELLRIELESSRVESLRKQAFVELAASLGAPKLSIKNLVGDLEKRLELSNAKRLVAQLEKTPELQLAQAQENSRKAKIALIEAESIPDISVDLFYRRLEDDKVDSIDLGVSIPLTIFDRRQGDLLTATAEFEKSKARTQRIRNELEMRIKRNSLMLKSALTRSVLLRDKVLPRSNTILRAAQVRFKAGDIASQELLRRQRESVSLQMTYLESLRDVMLAWAELSSLAPKS